jgi:hypothetical protein
MSTEMTDDGKGAYPYHPIKVLEVNKAQARCVGVEPGDEDLAR